MAIDAKKIDIARFEKSGEGANGSSYNSKTDPDIMVKMYNPGYDISTIVTEAEVARKVYDIGVVSPEPGQLVTDGERIGIMFRRIPGKVSFARAIANEPQRCKELAVQFAHMCRELHATECPEGLFPNAKDQFLGLLEADTAFNAEEKERIAAFIKAAPDCRTAIHGDMHFGNAVLDGEGRGLWIDLGYFACGYPMFDLGMTYIVTHHNSDEFTFENFHFHNPQALEFWNFFIPEYLGTDDPAVIAAKEQEIKAFAALKTLLIEYNCGNVLFDWCKKMFYGTIL